jgi:hypothetical protein
MGLNFSLTGYGCRPFLKGFSAFGGFLTAKRQFALGLTSKNKLYITVENEIPGIQ